MAWGFGRLPHNLMKNLDMKKSQLKKCQETALKSGKRSNLTTGSTEMAKRNVTSGSVGSREPNAAVTTLCTFKQIIFQKTLLS